MSIEIARQTVAEFREEGLTIELDEDGEVRLDFPRRVGEPHRQVFRHLVVRLYDAIREVLEEEADADG